MRIISLIEFSSSLFIDISSQEWKSLQKIVDQAKSLLWITNGGLIGGREPLLSMFGGVARGLRTERGDMKITIFDLDRAEDTPLGDLFDIFLKLLEVSSKGTSDSYEMEYREHGGLIYCGRLQPDDSMNEDWQARARNQTVADLIPLRHFEDTRIRLDIDKPHVLSTLHFRKDTDIDTKLPDDYVEIKVAAFGINNRVSEDRHSSAGAND